MTDTHGYDGKWKERLDKLLGLQLEERDSFDVPMPAGAAQWAGVLLADGTVDPSNGVTPRQLTRMLAARMSALRRELTDAEYEFTARAVFEQIADVSNGPCIQGRTTRVFQILAALVGI